MVAFSQWQKTRPVRRLTWVCGPEHVLADDVAAECRSQAGEVLVLVAGDDAERDIWAEAAQVPDPGETRLLVIRGAERLRRWDMLAPLVPARDLAASRLLFVSAEDDAAHAKSCSCRRCGGQESARELAPHLSLIQGSKAGQIIRCAVPDDEPPDWLLDWLAARLPGGGRVLADYPLERAGGDLKTAADTAAKMTAAGLPATREAVSELIEPVPSDSVADALVLSTKAAALAAADALRSRQEIGRVIGALDNRLEMLAALRAAQERKLHARDTAAKAGVSWLNQRRYRSAAAHYGPAEVARRRRVLAIADDAWRCGADAGVTEVIIAAW